MPHLIRNAGQAAGLALALGVAACTVDTPAPVSPAPEAGVAGGAATTIDGFDWNFSSHDGESRLVFGVPHSDQSLLGLSCADGSGQVEVFSDTDAAHAAEFHLESGEDSHRIAAASEPSAMTGGQFLTASAAASDPVLRQFRSNGWLAVRHGVRRDVLVSQPGSEDNVERFFTACG